MNKLFTFLLLIAFLFPLLTPTTVFAAPPRKTITCEAVISVPRNATLKPASALPGGISAHLARMSPSRVALAIIIGAAVIVIIIFGGWWWGKKR
jgi:hypothetical protein